MSYFYLVASLPGLVFDATPPVAVADFRFQCGGVLTAADLDELDHVLDGEPEAGRSDFARRWHGVDHQLRSSAARLRAARLALDARAYRRDFPGFDGYVEACVGEAFTKTNPLDRERLLDQCRWRVATELGEADPFGLAMALAYGVRLQIAWRWASMDDETGWAKLDEALTACLASAPAAAAEVSVG